MNANARALLAAHARRGAADAGAGSSIVAISSLGAQRVLENYVARRARRKRRSRRSSAIWRSSSRPAAIRVNAVSGGVVETGALEHFPNREQMLAAGAANPVGRLVEPDDIAGAVAFLCSPDAEMIRGQTLIVDGGFSLLA